MADAHAPYALRGRIVTMDATRRIIKDGVLYIANGVIVDIRAPGDAAPAGFKDAPRINTQGTIYPGMLELHNHLSYNILPLWNVTGNFTNNGMWRSAVDKRKYISGPMALLNEATGYLAAIVRFVETKCLLAGVTTSQGLTLINANGIEKKYQGIVRNCEAPDHPNLPKAAHKIDDVDSKKGFKPEDFLAKLKKLDGKGCLLLHLSEGIDDAAQGHFTVLELGDHSGWAITDHLVGIHSAGLHEADLKVFQQHGGSMVWSPLSNLMLYGGTARVRAAKNVGLPIALGSDWSPSGSKNLLAELKFASAYADADGPIFTDRELVEMVTTNPAKMLKWDHLLGSLEKNKLADLVVLSGKSTDAYAQLVGADETDVKLVVIGGVPRYGLASVMDDLGISGESFKIKGSSKQWVFNLKGAPDADVEMLTVADAVTVLKKGLSELPNPKKADPPVHADADAAGGTRKRRRVFTRILLENDGLEGEASRPFAPLTTGEVIAAAWAASIPLTELVGPVELDELTVAEDRDKYFKRIQGQKRLNDGVNVGAAFIDKLGKLYGVK